MENKRNLLAELLDLTELAILALDVSKSEDALIISKLFECCECAMKIPKRKPKKNWVKPWRRQRLEKGSFTFLTKELSNDASSYFKYIRMNEECFHFILDAIATDIRKQDTIMRDSICPAEQLSATLRYLATGESYKSTNFQSRLSESFLSRAIPKVCTAIWKRFKDEYLHVKF